MGRASRKSGATEVSPERGHWTETHPDQELWTPHQRALAESMSREAYEAVYGRGSAPQSFFEADGQFLLLRNRGDYRSFEEALGGQGIVSFRQAKDGAVSIQSLGVSGVAASSSEVTSFSLSKTQIDTMLGIATEANETIVPGKVFSWGEVWQGGDLSGNINTTGVMQHPYSKLAAKSAIESLGKGQACTLDTEGRAMVSYKPVLNDEEMQYVLEVKGHGWQVFETPDEAAAVAVAAVAGDNPDAMIMPRRAKGISGEEAFAEIGRRGSARLFATRNGAFYLEHEEDESSKPLLTGWMNGEELVLTSHTGKSVELGAEESVMLMRYILSFRGGRDG